MRFQLCMQSGHGLQVSVDGMAGRFMGTATFEQGHDRKDVVQVLFSDLIHKATPAGFVSNQTFGAEHFERFAQWRARYRPRLTQLHLIHPLTGDQIARKNQAAQTLGDFVMQ